MLLDSSWVYLAGREFVFVFSSRYIEEYVENGRILLYLTDFNTSIDLKNRKFNDVYIMKTKTWNMRYRW